MKTTSYNPSPVEVEFANIINQLQDKISNQLSDNNIIKVENKIHEDNPMVKFYLLDNDGDPHEVVLKIIQTPDKF
ncbi:MAG: hypothetical protein OEW67_00630 [Cyclobacteriaceae bacterium]|nr:hypothetical protein [Cyclobacteriaceae bacterium]